METKRFEIIINVLGSFFRFIWIPMLWVYDHYDLILPVRGPPLDRLQTSDSDV